MVNWLVAGMTGAAVVPTGNRDVAIIPESRAVSVVLAVIVGVYHALSFQTWPSFGWNKDIKSLLNILC